jgi:hypothetical protein
LLPDIPLHLHGGWQRLPILANSQIRPSSIPRHCFTDPLLSIHNSENELAIIGCWGSIRQLNFHEEEVPPTPGEADSRRDASAVPGRRTGRRIREAAVGPLTHIVTPKHLHQTDQIFLLL